jgi:hypothetical protein
MFTALFWRARLAAAMRAAIVLLIAVVSLLFAASVAAS